MSTNMKSTNTSSASAKTLKNRRRRQRRRQMRKSNNQAGNQSKQVKSKRNRAKSSVPAMARQRAETFALSECARDYLKVLVNPFWVCPRTVCVPDLLETPSLKLRFVIRGTGNTGTGGTGFVAASPFTGAINDTNFLCHSDTTYNVINTFPTDQTSTGVAGINNTQSPFPGNQVGSTQGLVQFRPVAAGLRMRYTGTVLNQSGTVYQAILPGAARLSQTHTSVLGAYQSVRTYAVNRNKWTYVFWVPQIAYDYDYHGAAVTTDIFSAQNNVLGLLMVGTLASAPFEYEYVGYYEYAGPRFGATASHSDIDGLSQVRNFTTEMIGNAQVPESGEQAFTFAADYFRSIVPDDVSGWVASTAGAVKTANQILSILH